MRASVCGTVAAAILILAASQSAAHQQVDRRILDFVRDLPETAIKDKAGRIKEGRRLFMEETFRGNGRTCATCHMPTESFALSPADIAARPANDPLFVAENNPNLRALENPALMRSQGLILENLDGFDQPGVMRGVPHTLGLRFSIQPDKGTPTRPAFPLANATGWSGDGSPGNGSLRNFLVGAIVQHFTLDLLRRPNNVDFRVPTKQELDNVEDFMLSLGRQTQISIEGDEGPALVFRDASAEAGKRLFLSAPSRQGTRSCTGCHGEAGALDSAGNNRQFDTGVANRPRAPGCLGDAPGDGGFGVTPIVSRTIACESGTPTTETFRGNGQFNTPSLIEAADTVPLFHNNSAATIEEGVTHYTTEAFNASPAGNNNAFVLTQEQIQQIGGFLRALNARDNTENAIRVLRRALQEGGDQERNTIREALADTQDAMTVLRESPLPLYAGTDIMPLLTAAETAQQDAIGRNGGRQQLVRSAVASLVKASNLYSR